MQVSSLSYKHLSMGLLSLAALFFFSSASAGPMEARDVNIISCKKQFCVEIVTDKITDSSMSPVYTFSKAKVKIHDNTNTYEPPGYFSGYFNHDEESFYLYGNDGQNDLFVDLKKRELFRHLSQNP